MRTRLGATCPSRSSYCCPIGRDGPKPSGESQTAQTAQFQNLLRVRSGSLALPDRAKTPTFVKTVIIFSFLSKFGHMNYRWKALGTRYHLQFESPQNHLYIERYVHTKSTLCPKWCFPSTQPHLHTHAPPWAPYHAIYPTISHLEIGVSGVNFISSSSSHSCHYNK